MRAACGRAPHRTGPHGRPAGAEAPPGRANGRATVLKSTKAWALACAVGSELPPQGASHRGGPPGRQVCLADVQRPLRRPFCSTPAHARESHRGAERARGVGDGAPGGDARHQALSHPRDALAGRHLPPTSGALGTRPVGRVSPAGPWQSPHGSTGLTHGPDGRRRRQSPGISGNASPPPPPQSPAFPAQQGAGRTPTSRHEEGDAEPAIEHPLPQSGQAGPVEGQGAADEDVQHDAKALRQPDSAVSASVARPGATRSTDHA